MTVQTKHFIELTDLVALRFTCKHCEATLSLPLSDIKLSTGENSPINMFLGNCPSCGRGWMLTNGATYEPIVKKFTAALNRLREMLQQEPPAPIGCSLMLELKPESLENKQK
jgi:hypothetical protein